MALTKDIWPSYSEKRLYYHLKSVWENKFNIYTGLKITRIFNINTLHVTEDEEKFLKKTEVDITICDKQDKPLLGIEFDGKQGYSKKHTYIQGKYDPERKRKLDLKLQLLRRS
ncbi:MAG: DUF2726 domain-containing protein [bacterium]|nr:DUF2726 domain-containing protein [bacterium]